MRTTTHDQQAKCILRDGLQIFLEGKKITFGLYDVWYQNIHGDVIDYPVANGTEFVLEDERNVGLTNVIYMLNQV